MEKLKVVWLSLALAILFIPLSFSLKKFTTIEAAQKPKVSYDVVFCEECKDCPCSITFKDSVKYTVMSGDKDLCKVGVENAFKEYEMNDTIKTFYMDGYDYNQYSSCIQWYSKHPSLAQN